MEPQRKLLATDRFSTLPDEIAHDILSRLCIEEIIQVGAVSKKCHEFYLSAPSFYFPAYTDNIRLKLIKMNCFERFLHRRGNNKIKRFAMNLSFRENQSHKGFQVMRWIDTAARCNNLEELDLQLVLMGSLWDTIGLPFSIFCSRSLRSLKLHFKIFKVPSFPCPNNLQRLILLHTKLDEGFSKWLSRSCKCIKELQLHYVATESLTVDSTSLESFTFRAFSKLCCLHISGEKLESIDIKWDYERPGRASHIFAPNLKYLKRTGNLVCPLKLGKLLCLEKAEISLEADSNSVCDVQNVFEVVCSIRTAKALILCSDTIKALFKEGCMAAPIFDTSYLRINIARLSNDLVPAMVSLLRGMANLNTLDIKSQTNQPKEAGYDGNYWKSQNLEFVNQLKEVTIELSKGSNELQLASFILEHAENLKKMTVFYLPRRSGARKKLMNSKKISSATIDFKEKRLR